MPGRSPWHQYWAHLLRMEKVECGAPEILALSEGARIDSRTFEANLPIQ